MRNELLTDFDFINGCNNVIKKTLTQYSGQLREQQMAQELSCEQFGSAKYDISYILLHNESNGRRSEIESEIDKIQNSPKEKDIERVETLKNEHQKLEDEQEVENAKRATY